MSLTLSLPSVSAIKKNASLALVAGVASVGVLLASDVKVNAQESGLAASIAMIETTMTALEGIAETGVAIVVVPFGIGFALKIASHVLRAGT
jgi:hypothetical protein